MSAIHRRALAGAAGAVLVGAAAPAEAARLDSELLRLVEQFVGHIADERACLAAMTQEEQGVFHQGRFEERYVRGLPSTTDTMAAAIARIPARTPAGVKAKARALIWLHGGTDAGPLIAIGDGMFESLLADLTGTPCRLRGPSRVSAGENVA